MGRRAKPDEVKVTILNRLIERPKLAPACRAAGISTVTLYQWIKESVADPASHRVKWLGNDAPLHVHISTARRLATITLDHSARELGISGHVTPKFFQGQPVWKQDPKVAADAIAFDDDTWFQEYGARPRSDVYARDEQGRLIQEVEHSPPNPQVLNKLLSSLAPELYGERSEVNVNHTGSVWIEGGTQATPAQLPAPDSFSDFGLTSRPDEIKRPVNTLAIPRPCKDSAEFDARFRKKLLREVVLFRDAEGKLLPPLPDDVIVAGTPQARAFEDAGIAVTLIHPTVLLDEGFLNDWLIALAPGYKPKPPKPSPEVKDAGGHDREPEVSMAPLVPPPVERPGKASSRYDAENIGRGSPPPGGRRVEL